MDMIYDWVKNIVFFLFLISIINNLIGESSYRKYVNLVTGMILIILIISPITDLFSINEKIDYYFSKSTFEADTENINNKFIKIESEQRASIVKKYKKEIEEQTARLLEKKALYISSLEVKISEENDSFGKIEWMNLIASYTVQEKNNISAPIEKVEIGKIEIDKDKDLQENLNEDNEYTRDEIYIRDMLSDFYNIDINNINIKINVD